MTTPQSGAGSIPDGGALPPIPPAAAQGTGSTSSGFAPPFQFGKGKSGVFTDPRQQIAGGTSSDIQAPAAPSTGPPAASNIGGGGASSSATPLPKVPSKNNKKASDGGPAKLNLPGSIDQQVQEGMNY